MFEKALRIHVVKSYTFGLGVYILKTKQINLTEHVREGFANTRC